MAEKRLWDRKSPSGGNVFKNPARYIFSFLLLLSFPLMKYTNTGSASPVSHVFFTFQVQRGLQATSEFQNPHFQNEAKCTTFIVKMNFTCMRMKKHFHIKG